MGGGRVSCSTAIPKGYTYGRIKYMFSSGEIVNKMYILKRSVLSIKT